MRALEDRVGTGRAVLLWSAVACASRTPAQRACLDYAAVFAEVAASDCNRGSLEDNLAAFKDAARVGDDCELVTSIRDQGALESACFDWLRSEVPRDCGLLDDGSTFLEALPDACKGQLELE